jgi:predicted transcriptional regulator
MKNEYRMSDQSTYKVYLARMRRFALQGKKEKLPNRSKLDIIYDILVSATGGVKKTHIMARANLSSEQMNFYFNALLLHSLLDADKDSESNLIYRTTQKGVKFLHCCANIKLLIAPATKVRMQNELLFL